MSVGLTYLDADFGYQPPAPLPSVSGNIWNDLDRSGIDEGAGEPPIASVTVALINAAGVTVGVTTTDVGGYYEFPGVPPGDYTVRVTDAGGLLDGYDLTGDGTGPWPAGQTPNEYAITVAAADITDLDFGYVRQPETGSIGDRVWQDTDADRNQDAMEPGIQNVRVTLWEDLNRNGVIDAGDRDAGSLLTGADGIYNFTGLPAGNYIVDVDGTTIPAGFVLTTANDPYRVNLSDDENYVLADFGYQPRAVLYGRVFEDEDGDGVQDPGEPGLSGVTVTVTDSLGGVHTLTTDANGDWRVDIPAGPATADVDESTLPLGMVQTAGADPTTTNVPAGTTTHGGDDGYQRRNGVIGDLVWYDDDEDNFPDPGEAGIPGVTVSLYRDVNGDGQLDGGDALVATQTTDASGGYRFTGLPAGAYLVDATRTADMLAGHYRLSDGGRDPHPVVIGKGGAYLDADFGYHREIQVVSAFKSWTDVTGGDTVAGDGIAYTVTLVNETNFNVTGAEFRDFIPNHATYAAGSLEVPAGAVVVSESPEIRITGITIPAGGSVPIRFRVTVADPLPVDVTEIVNQGVVYYDTDADGRNDGERPTDGEPDTPGEQPTVTPLVRPLAAIGDRVWYDTNDDGIQDAGEPGASGVLVRLLDASGNVVAEIRTDADGYYRFENLEPGQWAVQVVSPSTAFSFSPEGDDGDDVTESFDSDVDGVTGRTLLVTVLPGQTELRVDAGLSIPGASPSLLGDRVWYDANHDGIQDPGEPGVAGVTVRLLNAAGEVVAEDVTDGEGGYLFSGLAPGQWRVEVVPPAGYTVSPQRQGSDADRDSDIDPATGRTGAVTLTAGQRHLGLDAGLFSETPPASLGDFVWLDANRDGLQAPDEPGIAGVIVRLYAADGLTLVSTTVTDEDGAYAFDGLMPGDYVVEFVEPDGFSFTGRWMNATPSADSDADPATGRVSVILDPGEDRVDIDAGLFTDATLITLGDLVWLDANDNGAFDDGEGLSGVTLTLYDGNGLPVRTTVTDAEGAYRFPNLPPGDWRVSVAADTLPDGVAILADPDAVADGASQVIGQTTDNLDLDFGYRPVRRITIGDLVWLDANRNGRPDTGEGISGVTLTLYDGNGAVVATTTTDASGNYHFPDLPAGQNWRVVVDPATLPPNVSPLADPDGTLDSRTSLTNQTVDNPDVDFGYVPPGGGGDPTRSSLGDRFWNDLDADGLQDAGEPGVAGVTVRLYDATGTVLIAETLTGANGFYLFTGLEAGSYVVEFKSPANWRFTTALAGDPALDSNADPATGRVSVTLGSGVTDLSIDAGGVRTATVSIGDLVWLDGNGDGVFEDGEGLPGIRVVLYDGAGNVVADTLTDADGRYLFDELPAGADWRVAVDPATLPAGVVVFADPDGVADGATSLPDLDADHWDADFGYRPRTSVPDLGNATKTATDENGGQLMTGDVIAYTVTLYNAGGGAATNVVFTDTPDGHTTLVAGSVTTSAGKVLAGGAPVTVGVGTMAPGATVVIRYRVRVNADAPAGAWITNQGRVTLDGRPDVVTDFPSTPVPDDPTVIGPVGGDMTDARLTADKTATDVNGSSLKAGEILAYEIVVTNEGPDPATNVTFHDAVPSRTTLVAGTLSASRGTATEADPLRVTLDRLEAGESLTIRFQARVDADAPAGTVIRNQGIVRADGGLEAATDDPGTPTVEDPTDTPVGGDLSLEAYKSALDVNGGLLLPGDVVEYTLTVIHTGQTTITGIRIQDQPQGLIRLLPGTVGNTAGRVVVGNRPWDYRLDVAVDSLAPGERVVVTFQALVAPCCIGVERIPNQGTVWADGLPAFPTDDPSTDEPDDPTVVVTGQEPGDRLSPPVAAKTVSGDWPLYRWEMSWSHANATAMLLHVEDPLPADVTLVSGSLGADFGAIRYDAARHLVIWDGTVPANGRIRIWFVTRLPDDRDGMDNTACAVWDTDGDGDWTDEARDATNPVCATASRFDAGCDMALGDRVWIDKNPSGTCDPSVDNPVNGVTMNLYADTDGDNRYTPGVDQWLQSTVTAQVDGRDGIYRFEDLCPGDYIVQVDASAFASGGPLRGYVSLTGAPDPDDDVDDDDNGYLLENHGAPAAAVTLRSHREPADDGDGDHETNLTVDFGFYKSCPSCDVPIKPF